MSPFTVNTEKDDGYVATNSLIGGRMNTQLLMTPGEVTVLTKEFLDDIMSTDYMDAAAWLPSADVTPLDVGVPVDPGNRVKFRGMDAGFASRNYFRYINNIDSYNVERMESARGPASLLFGDGVAGGMINFETKRAIVGRTISEVRARFDSEGGLRATVDANRYYKDKFALRLNVLANEGRTWQDTFFNNRYAGHLAATWRPTRRTEIRVEGELADWKQNYAPAFMVDQASTWPGQNYVTARSASAPSGGGVAMFANNANTAQRALIYAPAYFGTYGIMNYYGLGQSQGSGITMPVGERNMDRLPEVPKGYSIQPPNFLTHNRYNVGAVAVQQIITKDLVVEVAAQHAQTKIDFDQGVWNNIRRDPNEVIPTYNPANNTHGLVANPRAGEMYSEVNVVTQTNNQYNNDIRLAAAWRLPFRRFSQKVNMIAGRRHDNYFYQNHRWVRSNNPDVQALDATANIITTRYYLSDGPFRFTPPPAGSNGLEVENLLANDNRQKQNLDSIQFATVGSYWDDRISVVGGVRWDDYERKSSSIGARILGRPDPEGYSKSGFKQSVFSPTFGAVVFPIRAVGAYFNYSETFNPTAPTWAKLNGGFLDPVRSKGRSYGLRFNLFAGKIVGSAGYYLTNQVNNPSSWRTANFNNIWDEMNLSQNRIDATSYADSSTIEARGYEVELVGNPTKNLRIMANLSFPETRQTDSMADTQAYYNRNITQWRAAAEGNNVIANELSQIETYLQTLNDGRRRNGTLRYNANIFGVYTFRETVLKGLRVGGGVNFYGARLIGNQNNRPFDYIYNSTYQLYSATLGYSFKLKKSSVDIQLNVTNLFDYDDPIYTTTFLRGNGTSIPYVMENQNFTYSEPRKIVCAVIFKF
jgi:outer membrane receptor protein involved in Fe transport